MHGVLLLSLVGCASAGTDDSSAATRAGSIEIAGPGGDPVLVSIESIEVATDDPESIQIASVVDGAAFSVTIDGIDATAASITATTHDGQAYELVLGPNEAQLVIDYGARQQIVTVFDTRGLDRARQSNVDVHDRMLAVEGPLRHSARHAVVLALLDELARTDVRLAPLAERVAMLTAEIAMHEDESAEVHDLPLTLATPPSAAQYPEDEGGHEEGGYEGGDDGADEEDDATAEPVECKPEVEKAWAAGDALDLQAGPVTVSASLVKVKGTSICDASEGSIKTETTGQLNKSFRAAAQGECSDGYESVYMLSGSKAAKANHVKCCWADGKADEAVAGDLKITIGNYSLSVQGAKASSDMTSSALASVNANIKLCVDEDFFDEGHGVSEVWTATATIN